MIKVRSIYSRKGAKENGRTGNRVGVGRGQVRANIEQVQPGADQGHGDQHGAEALLGAPDNQGNALQLPGESGKRPRRNVRQTKAQAKGIRAACKALLDSKPDSEMTEEDKNLLRQYEGAGGLGEEASTHGTLYEFYTPRNVVSKVWQLVDKYIPGEKSVLEPSAGIGRFAEGRRDHFHLNEYDKTSSGVDVKSLAVGIEVNSVSTVFGYKTNGQIRGDFIYIAENITPDQASLLGRLDSSSYPPTQGVIPYMVPQPGEMASAEPEESAANHSARFAV